MDGQLPQEPNVIIVHNIPFSENSLIDLPSLNSEATKARDAIAFLQSDKTREELNISPPISPRLETKSEENGNEAIKKPKMASFLHAFEALKGLTNVSKDEIAKLEGNLTEYARIKEQSIEEQQKTNELLLQLSQRLEKLDTRETKIQELQNDSDNHEQCLRLTQTNIHLLEARLNDFLEYITSNKENIAELQTNINKTLNIANLAHSRQDLHLKQIESNKQAFVDLSKRVESLQQTNQSLLRRVQIYMTGSVAILMAAIWIWWHTYQK